MSAVVERIAERRTKIHEKVSEGLGTEPFAVMMRKGTWRDHTRAETSDFEVALVKGTISEAAYADLMVQMWFVYGVLEERAIELADEPNCKKIINPVLNRMAKIESDLEDFYGADWKSKLEMLPVTEEYVQRIKDAEPHLYAAHHYTRYLADLSGGVDIHRGLTKAFGDPDRGLSYYKFEEIEDGNAFKVGYREALNSLDLSREQQLAIIEEVAIAYEFNIEIVADLAVKHNLPSSKN